MILTVLHTESVFVITRVRGGGGGWESSIIMAECARLEEINLSLGWELPVDPNLCMNHSIGVTSCPIIIHYCSQVAETGV